MPKSFMGTHKVFLRCPECSIECVKKKMKSHMIKVHDIDITEREIVVKKEN